MNQYEKYKTSGIDWIGEIPSHWNTYRLKWIAKFEYGDSLATDERKDGEIPVYGSNGITGFHNKNISKSPCVIIGRKGSFGKVNWSEKVCYPIDTTYFIDETKTQNNLRWIFYLLPNLGLDLFSRDTGVPGLNREDAYQNIVPLPPLEEQTAIVQHIQTETQRIDNTISKMEREMELMNEYRTALISEVVTGKIKVTGNG